jgi:hypothetical protein
MVSSDQQEENSRPCWQPSTDADRRVVLDQLDRLLRDPLFAHSKRYPVLLRYVIEKTLRGESADLKERTVGIEAFGRTPDYDTNADTVVRVTAGEIRKRLAQYYYRPGHEDQIQIELPSGSYKPEFFLVGRSGTDTPSNTLPSVETHAESTAGDETGRTADHWPRGLLSLLLAVGICLCVGGIGWMLFLHAHAGERALAEFWKPTTASAPSALLCVGDRASYNAQRIALGEPPVPEQPSGAPAGTVAESMARDAVFSLNTFNYFNRVVNTLQSLQKQSKLTSASATSLTDLRQSPSVLIGFNNLWTIRVLEPLRFSFRMEKSGGVLIDRQNPGRPPLSLPLDLPFSKMSKDYGIIARLQEPSFDQPVVVVAGLGEPGTSACVEQVTDPALVLELLRNAPSNWMHMNMEALISSEVVNGNSGRPHIEAIYWW